MDHTISLATADRARSLIFYRDGLGLDAFGPIADDGVPEPLQLRLAPEVSLMLIPTGGFGWVVGEDRVAGPGTNECVLSVYVPDEDAVRARYVAALAAGGSSVYQPSQQTWGAFAAQVADPDGHLWMILVLPDWTAA
jgi:catechol 2,3-dioxygenase-like lactoylglutathione lyase family enzyme